MFTHLIKRRLNLALQRTWNRNAPATQVSTQKGQHIFLNVKLYLS